MTHTFTRGLLAVSLFGLMASSASAALPLAINMNRDLGTFSIGFVQVALTASGGGGTYTWSVAAGALPTGLNLAPVPGNNSQTGIAGIATCPSCTTGSNDTFSLSVTDGVHTVTQPFVMRITTLTLKDIGIRDAFAGAAYSYTFTALNGVKPTFTATNPGLPLGLTLSPAGVLSGTVPYPGTYRINLSIADSTDEIFRGFNLTVYGVELTTPGNLPNATQGEPYSTQLAASGGTGGYVFTAPNNNLPQGLSLSSGGLISGTTNNNTGLYGFNVNVTDSSGNSYQRTMSINVVTVGATQTQITLGTLDDAVVGNTYGWQIPMCCGGAEPFTWTATNLPPGMSIRTGSGITSDYVIPGFGEIWGVASAAGTYNVIVTVTDANKNTASLTFPLHVSALALEETYSLPNGTFNSPYTQNYEIVGGTPPYVSVAQTSGTLPNGLVLNTASLASGFFSVSGTPQENGGPFQPIFKVTDSAATANTLVRTNNFNINDVPGQININGNNVVVAQVSQVLSAQLSACCVSSYIWSVASGTPPPGLNLASDGAVSGTLTTAGTYVFVLEADDNAHVAASGFKTITFTVTPISITTNSLPFGNVGTAYSESLAATGGTGTLTWSLSNGSYLPAGLTLQANGTLSGTPTAAGQYGFPLIVADQGGNQQIQSWTLNIFPKGELPPITISNGPDLGTRDTGTDWIGLGANGGSGTYTWSLVSGKLPPGMVLSNQVPGNFPKNQQAVLVGVAAPIGNAATTYNFTLKVTSTGAPFGGASLTVPYTLRISPLNLQDATPPDGFVTVPFDYTFTPIGNAGPVTFTVNCNSTNCAPPPGLTLSSTGELAGTPTTPGNYILAMVLSDGTDQQYVQYNLRVYAVQITSAPLLPNGTQGSPYSTTLTASGGSGSGYSFSINNGGLPNGLTLAPDGSISGTITAGPGLYRFSVQVTDSASNSTGELMSLDVLGSPSEPPMRITTTWFNDPVLGDRYGAVGSICCGGTAPFTWTVSGLPPGMTYEANSNSFTNYASNPGGVQIYGIAEAAGNFQVTLTVTDANLASTSVIVPMHVSTLDVAIGTTQNGFGLPSGTVAVPYTTTFRVLGGTGLSDKATQTANGETPDGLKLSGLTLSGTPLENGNFGQVFEFTDSGGNTLSRNEGVTINDIAGSNISVNGNGWFGYNLGSVTGGVAYSTQLNACCTGSYVWSVPSGSKLPPGVTLSTGGLLSGTPPKVTAATTYTFLVEAANSSSLTDVGTKSFTLTVTPLAITNAAPPSGTVGTAYSFALTATGGKGTLTWAQPYNQGSALPPGLTLNSNGTITGMPTSAGSYFIIVEVSDSSKNTAITGYGITIAPE